MSRWDGDTIEVLKDKTLTSVEQRGNDEIYFTDTEGNVYKMYHSQNCCENVSIESIVGDLNDLVDSPITLAEEVTKDNPEDDCS